MRKLKLELEELHVESFDTSPGRGAGRGTVLGNAAYGAEAVAIGAEAEDKEALPLSYIVPGCTLSSCPTQDKTCFNTECGTCALDDTCVTGCFDTCPSGGIICCA
jgi:hypothetical protein